jgi:SWI/SNF-related matrix-associated actin-dependent regulator 1 of chromatin subfamily A
LKINRIKFLLLTGSTPVDIRQTLVDEFTDDDSISVFLLSTKAGGEYSFLDGRSDVDTLSGMGINLTAASVVIMYVYDPEDYFVR